MTPPFAIWIAIGFSLAAAEREGIDLLLPLAKSSKAQRDRPCDPPQTQEHSTPIPFCASSSKGVGLEIKSARVDWWKIRNASILATEAAAADSPIYVVLDFLHSVRENPECLIEEILPVLQDPAYRDRLHVLAVGGPPPYFQSLRGRYRTYQMLDPKHADPSRIREACGQPKSASQTIRTNPIAKLAVALGYSTSQFFNNWSRFQDSRSAIRELVEQLPAKGAPARVFWLAEDFRNFNGPPNGCDSGESENRTIVALGADCEVGGYVARDLLYFFLSEITHAGAVITPVMMMHPIAGSDDGIRRQSRAAAARMARFTGAPVVEADRHPSRALLAAIKASDRWPVATMSVPVVGMRAVVTQPRKLKIQLADGSRVERQFATKEGQVYLETDARQSRRYAGSSSMPIGAPIAVASTTRAVTISAGTRGPGPTWLLTRTLAVRVDSGCSGSSGTAANHELITVKVPEADWKGKGPVEVILRGAGALTQSLAATREELQNGACFGIPKRGTGGGVRLLIVDPEAGAGGVFESTSLR